MIYKGSQAVKDFENDMLYQQAHVIPDMDSRIDKKRALLKEGIRGKLFLDINDSEHIRYALCGWTCSEDEARSFLNDEIKADPLIRFTTWVSYCELTNDSEVWERVKLDFRREFLEYMERIAKLVIKWRDEGYYTPDKLADEIKKFRLDPAWLIDFENDLKTDLAGFKDLFEALKTPIAEYKPPK